MTDHNRAHPSDRAGGLRPEPPAESQPKALIPCAFTPGPWRWFGKQLVTDALTIARSVEWWNGKEADAYLIAAAPDLYDVLNDAAEAIGSLDEDALGYASDGHGEVHWPIRDELMAKIGTALAKARGDQ